MELDFAGQCDLIIELPQDWNRLLEGTNKTLWAPEAKSKSSVPRREWVRLDGECSGVSSRGMVKEWDAVGWWTLHTRVLAQILLKKVPITFITHTIVRPQVKQQGLNTATPIKSKLDKRFTEYGPIYQNRTWIHSQSVYPIRKFP